jgi:hypothetical protein
MLFDDNAWSREGVIMIGAHNARAPLAHLTVAGQHVQAWGQPARTGRTLHALRLFLAILVVLAPARSVQATQGTRRVEHSFRALDAVSARERAVPPAVKVRFYHVDVGGYTLDMVCSGTGSPTVVFEAGSGADWSTWVYVMPGLLLRPSALNPPAGPGRCTLLCVLSGRQRDE